VAFRGSAHRPSGHRDKQSILAIVDGAESITKEDFPERAWGGVGEESLMHELNARGRLQSATLVCDDLD